MKLFKILSHPYTLIICFLMIMISGEHLGGFYALYLLLALPHGGIHAVLAVAGIVVILICREMKSPAIRQLMSIIGVLLLFSSLYFFFYNDKNHYNWGSFEQTIPLLSMIITACVGIFFLIGAFINTTTSNKILSAKIFF